MLRRDTGRKAERAASRHWVDVRPRMFFVFSAAARVEVREVISIDTEPIATADCVSPATAYLFLDIATHAVMSAPAS